MAYPTTDAGDRPPRDARPPARSSGAAGRFPTIDCVSLAGRRTRLPDDLAGGPALLLIAFQRWQQELIAGWTHPLARLRRELPRLAVHEVALVSRRYLPLRPLIDGGISRSLRDDDLRTRTLTAYVNVDQVVAGLGLAGAENIALRLLDATGSVVWVGRGVYDSDQLAAIRQAVLGIDEATAHRGGETP